MSRRSERGEVCRDGEERGLSLHVKGRFCRIERLRQEPPAPVSEWSFGFTTHLTHHSLTPVSCRPDGKGKMSRSARAPMLMISLDLVRCYSRRYERDHNAAALRDVLDERSG